MHVVICQPTPRFASSNTCAAITNSWNSEIWSWCCINSTFNLKSLQSAHNAEHKHYYENTILCRSIVNFLLSWCYMQSCYGPCNSWKELQTKVVSWELAWFSGTHPTFTACCAEEQKGWVGVRHTGTWCKAYHVVHNKKKKIYFSDELQNICIIIYYALLKTTQTTQITFRHLVAYVYYLEILVNFVTACIL